MATEDSFKKLFISPLAECYGAQKLPGVRIQFMWARLKNYPDHVLKQAAEKIILTCDLFPGIQRVFEVCAEVGGENARSEADKLKDKANCYRCNSHGVVQVNNHAYKCTCSLGDLLYPSFPRYQGQLHIVDTVTENEDGTIIRENSNYKYTSPKSKNIRDFSFVIKNPIEVLPKIEKPNFQRPFINGDDIA